MTDLRTIKSFPSLIKYLRDELDWPIESEDFEDLTFDYTPEELGIDAGSAAKIQEIKRLRPLSSNQPWGVFFVKFEPKKLPVVALRRILSRVVVKKRASANRDELPSWQMEDILFISNYGEGDSRQLTFAHFSGDEGEGNLPTLKVLGWDGSNTALRLERGEQLLREHLRWPDDEGDSGAWRNQWQSAFALRHREVITTSKLLALRLAEVARSIRGRIRSALEVETENGPLRKLMSAFQQGLVHDLDEDGFADTYAQTITYGLLSARIATPVTERPGEFSLPVTNPFLKELMEAFFRAGKGRGRAAGIEIDFDELGVGEVIELLDDAKMGEVLRDFGDRNPLEDPVIHFYELFLKEYDARARLERGVFYTPRPVVSYIVRGVHEFLRREFSLTDGLADNATWGEVAKRQKGVTIPDGVKPGDRFVSILDPATGTGTFLVETIDLIHRTLMDRWRSERRSEQECNELWNEYVPEHLLPRLHGFELLMAPYAIAHVKVGLKLHETGYRFESDERARIFLTNTLEKPVHQVTLALPALAHEAKAVSEVKNGQHFTVVIGNPPYSLLSQNLTDDARAIVDPYRYVEGIQIKERGALQFEKILQDDYVKFFRYSEAQILRSGAGVLGLVTNHAYIDNPTLRGMRSSLLATFQNLASLNLHGNSSKKERSPDGSPDENVFDIKQGVAIFIGSRAQGGRQSRLTGDLWGTAERKYAVLAEGPQWSTYSPFDPAPPMFLFKIRNESIAREYESGWKLTDIFGQMGMGVVTARDNISIAFDDEPLIANAKKFRDSPLSDEKICEELDISMKKGWDVAKARAMLRREGSLRSFVRSINYRPFDSRRVFYHRSLVWGMSAPTMQHFVKRENLGLSTTRSVESGPFRHVFASSDIIGHHFVSLKEVNYLMPLWLYDERGSKRTSNIASGFVSAMNAALNGHGKPPNKASAPLPEEMFNFLYAVLHSPTYRSRYEEPLRSDFPRVPLPGSSELFREMVSLGSDLVKLHVSPPKTPARRFFGEEDPVVQIVRFEKESVLLDDSGTCGFRGVPEGVWGFHVGGYQVAEKWLKDRRGRTLTSEDISHYDGVLAAIEGTQALMARIDESILRHGGWPNAFEAGASPAPLGGQTTLSGGIVGQSTLLGKGKKLR